mmetsp:Transcript_30148/g.93257  ORF Transcript_30148/g.93257 Transcript_30148/m.93257 type:complete len:156 (+) Transcript_30148:495-962(+)
MVEGTAPSSSSRQQLAPSSSSRRELGARSTRRYERALAAALGSSRDRGLASIPASNRAQVALELGEAADAQRRTESLLRRDPNFVDGRALLAAVKYERGDKAGAEEAYAQLCVPAIASQSAARYLAARPGPPRMFADRMSRNTPASTLRTKETAS